MSLQDLQELQASSKQLAQGVSAAQAAAAAEKQRAAGLRKELAAERAATSTASAAARCHVHCSTLFPSSGLRLHRLYKYGTNIYNIYTQPKHLHVWTTYTHHL